MSFSPQSAARASETHTLHKTRRKTTKGKDAGVVTGRLLSRFTISSWQAEFCFSQSIVKISPIEFCSAKSAWSRVSYQYRRQPPFPPGIKKRFFDQTANQVAPPTPSHSTYRCSTFFISSKSRTPCKNTVACGLKIHLHFCFCLLWSQFIPEHLPQRFETSLCSLSVLLFLSTFGLLFFFAVM